MRLRVGVAVCLFLALIAAGCRKGLEPSFDNNQAPETWITGAPADTITTKDNLGRPIPPVEGRIPVRYHIYWAGSDKDGAVVGYYWAVTETVAVSPGPGLPIPELPGPRARDYHFTRRSDSIFVFDVSVDSPEREHGFFVYAVDDKGKVDPTPARLTFRAYDRFPPIPVFDVARATGKIYVATPGGVTSETQSFDMHGPFIPGNPFPTDIVPSGSLLTFAWHSQPPLPTSICTGYRYRLDEPDFNVVDSSVKTVTYNTGVNGDVIAPGVKKFTLQALDQAGGHGDSTRYFQVNFEPDEWFSGPDTSSSYWNTYTDGNGKRYWYRDITSPTDLSMTWASWSAAGGAPGTMLSPDSAQVLPASRPNRRTFFEIYAHRLWAHVEGDTVNLNSIVIFPMGGLDKDSPYAVKVGIDPSRPIGPVTTPGPANGSPAGFRSLVLTRKMDRSFQTPTETTVFPVYDVTSPYWLPLINPIADMQVTGKAYAYAVAQDGDGLVDRRIRRASPSGPALIVDAVDQDYTADPNAGTPTPDMIAMRPHIMMFFVNHKPFLKTGDPTFTPHLDGSSAYRRGTAVSFNLLADDLDPIDYAGSYAPPGGPTPGAAPVLVYTVTISGSDTLGNAVTYPIASSLAAGGTISFTMPLNLALGAATANVTLCDYRPTDAAVGNFGRCADTVQIPFTVLGPAPARATYPSSSSSSTSSTTSTHRPGSPSADGRRQLP